MKFDVFSVLDVVVGEYLEPFFQRNVAEASRTFAAVCSREGHQFGEHPTDYCLYKIGTYDSESGTLEGCAPQKIGLAADFITPKLGVMADA